MFKFILARESLDFPIYVTLSPEKQVFGKESENKTVAKNLLTGNSGFLNITPKKYFSFNPYKDMCFSLPAFCSVTFFEKIESGEVYEDLNMAFTFGAGLNFSSRLYSVNEMLGFIQVEGQFVYFKPSGEMYHVLFGPDAKDEFTGWNAIVHLKLTDFLYTIFSYSQAQDSGIATLDKGLTKISVAVNQEVRKIFE